jgi:hypothetical protein
LLRDMSGLASLQPRNKSIYFEEHIGFTRKKDWVMTAAIRTTRAC